MSRATRAAALRTVRDVAIGGAIGALLRTGVVLVAVAAIDDDLGALVVLNLSGAYLLARLLVRAEHDPAWVTRLPLLGSGLLGSVTTFSGLVVPVAALAVDGRAGAATAWAAGSLALGILAAAAGVREPVR